MAEDEPIILTGFIHILEDTLPDIQAFGFVRSAILRECLLRAKEAELRNVRYRLQMMSGGSMELQSTPSAGTTVTVRIPPASN